MQRQRSPAVQAAPQTLRLSQTPPQHWHLSARGAVGRLARRAAPRRRPQRLSLHRTLPGRQRPASCRAAQLWGKLAALRRPPPSRTPRLANQGGQHETRGPPAQPRERAAGPPRRPLSQSLPRLLRWRCRAAAQQAMRADRQRPPLSQASSRRAGRCLHAPRLPRLHLPWLLHVGLGTDPAAQTLHGLRACRRNGFAPRPRPAARLMLPPTRPTPSARRRGRLHPRSPRRAGWHAAAAWTQVRRTP